MYYIVLHITADKQGMSAQRVGYIWTGVWGHAPSIQHVIISELFENAYESKLYFHYYNTVKMKFGIIHSYARFTVDIIHMTVYEYNYISFLRKQRVIS